LVDFVHQDIHPRVVGPVDRKQKRHDDQDEDGQGDVKSEVVQPQNAEADELAESQKVIANPNVFAFERRDERSLRNVRVLDRRGV
jgi:hypothetical protein